MTDRDDYERALYMLRRSGDVLRVTGAPYLERGLERVADRLHLQERRISQLVTALSSALDYAGWENPAYIDEVEALDPQWQEWGCDRIPGTILGTDDSEADS